MEGLVKKTASAEVKMEHLDAEGSSSLVYQMLFGPEGMPWIAMK